MAWGTFGAIQQNYELQKKVDTLGNDIVTIESKNEELEVDVEFYKTDEYLDYSIRNNLKKIKPGEKVFISKKYDDLYKNIDLDQTNNEDDLSNISKWFDFLFGINL